MGRDSGGHLEVTLQNSKILARYAIGPGGRKGREWAIRDFVIKGAGEDQAGKYIDACASRGFLERAWVKRDDADVKTVRLRFDDGNCQDVSIFRDRLFLRIDYVKYGVNIVDIGSPGGGEGRYVFHGADGWKRGYEALPKSYYNRYSPDGYRDVRDGGSLSYNGWFIMGVYNEASGRGFGRIAPVEHINIIKLLLNRGFELFAHLGGGHRPYTGYLFAVTGGAEGVIPLGRRLADGVLWEIEGLGPDEPARMIKVAACLRQGWFGKALAEAEKELDSKDPADAEEARKVVEALESHAEKSRKEYADLKALYPASAAEALAKLAQRYGSTKAGRELSSEARAWNREPAAARAKRARRIYEIAAGAAEKLEGEATDPKFTRRHAREIGTIVQCARELRKRYPGTSSCRHVLALLETLGIDLPE